MGMRADGGKANKSTVGAESRSFLIAIHRGGQGMMSADGVRECMELGSEKVGGANFDGRHNNVGGIPKWIMGGRLLVRLRWRSILVLQDGT